MYDEISKSGSVSVKKYRETNSFIKILNISREYFKNNSSAKFIINIAARSAEFDAINQLLQDGGKLEDVQITKTSIIL